ncbi:putative protein C8orf34 like [Dissostichus eleginoides]|uniref:Uncharacterized protein n=1 Tax=Dissostichus eleginoides TaxID=100907 RepID=A0AAD9F1X7_DISEL|nr:putative protein C8orf34 like [Dissostichus eleginoides]
MTKLITETPDHPIPFLIDHLQTKQGSPGKLHRALSGSAALWAQSSPESKNPRRDSSGGYEKPWQIHPKKPKKSKSDLAVSSISPPSPESKSYELQKMKNFHFSSAINGSVLKDEEETKRLVPRSIECPSWDWRESRDFDELNHILQESKKLGKALESLSRSIAISDELDQNVGGYNSGVRPRVVGQWVGREEEDADPLASEMLKPPLPREKTEADALGSELHINDSSSSSPPPPLFLLLLFLSEDLDDLRMEGVTGLSSGSKFSQGRSSYQTEPQARVTLNICSRCARLQGDSLSDGRSEDFRPISSEQAVPDISGDSLLAFTSTDNIQTPTTGQLLHERQGVWEADLKPVRRGSAGGPMLGDPLFSKELENMGKQLAEVEKDLAKLAEVGKMTSRISNNLSLHHTPFLPPIHPPHRHLPDTLPLTMGRTPSPSNLSSRSTTPRTPITPITPNSLLRRSSFDRGAHKEVTFRRSRSRPVTPTCLPARPRPLLTPPGLSTTDSLGASLRAYLSEDEFYQQLQAIRQPWNIPSDTESDVLDPPEQDNSGARDAKKRSLFSGL